MRAVKYDRYGDFDQLEVREVPVPAPGEGEVRVRVRAAALHVGDCFGVRGNPFLMRMVSGLLRPKLGIPGFDVAGVVEAVGASVTAFAPGDEVFGACEGSCAEFVVTKADHLTTKPAGVSFEDAAALPTSGLAALHALRDTAGLEAGQHLLVNGASGGVGSYAVQIAKSLGAEVTGVCSSKNVELVQSLGADAVIDYTGEDFADGGARFDVIFDNVENRSLADCRRALTPEGTLVLNSGTGASGFAMMTRLLKPVLLNPFVRQRLLRYLSMPNSADLELLGSMAAEGTLRPLIDRIVGLEEVAEALIHIDTGHARGKVVVRIG
jgi:NADPH:quinone reductase-like Zn-dependent oxidoreductase